MEPLAQCLRWLVLVTALTATGGPGCGWKLGTAPVEALAVGEVRGAVLDPGLRESVRDQVVRALRSQGVRAGGASLDLTLSEAGSRVEAALPDQGGAALSEELLLVASIPSRPGCSVSVRGHRVWAVDAPALGADNRGDARDRLARLLAERAVDALLGSEACLRPS